MAAVIAPAPVLTPAAQAHRCVWFGNVEPGILALLKQVDPLIVVATLFACMVVISP